MARRGSDTELDELVAAARAVLAERGYDGLRVEDVLSRAGLSTRAFYRHFSGKSALFLHLFDDESALADQRLRARVEKALGPVAKIQEWIAAVLGMVYDPRRTNRARLFAGEQGSIARRFPNEMEQLNRRQLAPLENAIAAGRSEGIFPDAHPANDARAIQHLCFGLINDRLYATTSLARGEAIALATRFALGTLTSHS